MRIAALVTAVACSLLTACGGGGGEAAVTYSVSGLITPAAAGAGATVTVGSRSTVADGSGAWTVSGLASGSYTVTPTKAAVTFTPASRSITVGAADLTGVDFAALATYTITGTIRASGGQRVDVDTADPNTSTGNNDTPATAQVVPSAVTVGGWASASSDALDLYRTTLAAGQVVTLVIAESDPLANDLDLRLYSTADTSTPVEFSEGTGATEVVTVPASGEYFVWVGAASGASNYVLTIGAAPAAAAAAFDALRSGREFVPGEVLVRFKETPLTRAAAAAAADTLPARAAALGLLPLGGAVRGRHALLGLPASEEGRAQALVTLGVAPSATGGFGAGMDGPTAARLDTLAAVKALRKRADVQSADPNYVFHPSAVPTDEFYKFQWHYPAINLPQAWDVTTGTPATGSVVVAVIDTGIYAAHPDFAGQIVGGYDFITDPARARDGNGPDGNPDDAGDNPALGSSSWHGTHVAGTVAAATSFSGGTATGAAGVAPGAKLLPIRVLGQGGGTSNDIINGLYYAAGLATDYTPAAARRADVANLSLGCLGCFSATEQTAYTAARNTGLIVVAAAGNENSTTNGYPASYQGVISVSAVDMALARAPYSNHGPNVDVAAPGGDTSADRDGNGYVDGVLSALVDDSAGQGAARQPMWTFYQGTSMASPHVAGVVALMKSVCPSLLPAQVDTLLSSGALTTDLGAAGRDDVYGYGLIDALASVQAAQAACSAPVTGGLDVSPGRVDFAPGAGPATLTVAWTGGGPRNVSAVTVSAGATWLTVTRAGADAVTGYGTWTATANTAGLGAGRYAATITFALTGGGSVGVPVSLQVGSAAATASDAGFLYVLLLDTSLNAVAQAQGRGTSGTYQYSFTNVPPGDYLVAAGTDSDDDGLVCDAGEACGAWPTLGVPTAFSVSTANLTGVDFLAGFEVALGAAAAGPDLPSGGFHKVVPMKGLGVRP